MSLANMCLNLDKIRNDALDAQTTRDKFCLELKIKYGLEAKFGKKSWHVDWGNKEIVAD
jgi:hypothetical protein